MDRHLLRVGSNIQTHLAQRKYNTILGLDKQVFFFICGVIAVALTVLLIICILYRRYRTRVEYNQNPEQFPHLPDLGYWEERKLDKLQLKQLFGKVKTQKTQSYQGPLYKITYDDKQPSAIYIDNSQKKESYFQIEVLQLSNGEIVVGFMQAESFEKVKLKEEEVGYIGVSLSSSGFVVANGENLYNYNWNLDYGDVIGLGITPESDKFNERRAWISKNGVLLNFPPLDQMDKWLATVQISAEEREKFNIGKEKDEESDVEGADAEAVDKAAELQKAAIEREQNLLKSQRITIKTFKEFKYFPVICFPGTKHNRNEKQTGKRKKTILNLNVGGQIFRMQEGLFKGGVLK